MNENVRNAWGTLDQAAEMMGVSTKTIRRMLVAGDIRGVKFGPRLVRVWMPSIEQAAIPLVTDAPAA